MLGLKTAIIEKDPFLGGTCLHRGCIPTKALLHTAEIYDEIQHASEHGISVDNLKLDIHQVHRRKAGIVDKLADGVQFLMKKRDVEVFTGLGSFIDGSTIRVLGESGEETIRAEHVIIATGSVPADLPHIQADAETIINSDHVLQLEEIPDSMAVIGSGAVGSEFASVFASFGTKVHLIELLPRLLPIEDDDCSKQLERSFKDRGIQCHAGTEVTAVDKVSGGAVLKMRKGETEASLDVSRVLLAAGRRPVLDGLGHEAIGLTLDGRYVAVDEYMQTNVPGVYAIGDVVPTAALAHVASKEGIVAVNHIAGKHVRPIEYGKVPNCTYSSPEVASVGMTERGAKEAGIDYRVGKFPFSAIGKAMILGDTAGFIKIIAEKRYDEVIGVHIIGPKATELIAEATLGMNIETTAEEMAETIHAHPTLAEAMMEAAHSVYGEAIHI
ncbi:MAG: dihydrolipoyl dehydrogenase [Candidatus Krumholzibacteriota bacterium]|nr:dihydrolipoyl dehydrogenase [Candidatus Krumholzibacteriota bacterium]